MTEWKQVRLAVILREVDDRNHPELEVLSVYRDLGVVPKAGREDNFNKTPEDLGSYKRVNRGDVVINKMKAWSGSIALSHYDGIVSGDYMVCSVVGSVHPKFLHHLLRSRPVVSEIAARSTGIRPSQWRLYWEDLRDLSVALPSLDTQEAIANYLDRETERIDALVAATRRQQELVRERMRAHVIATMHEFARAEGTIPLRRLVACLDGRRIPLNTDERASRQGPYPYFGASSIVDYVDDYIFDETLVLLGEDGAQLGDLEYPIAQVVTGKVWVNNHAHVLRPHADPWFLVFHLNTFDRMSFISGATREKITQEDMGRIPVPNLSPPDQAAVAARLRAEQDRIDAMTRSLDMRVELLLERRQALITAAVTGALAIAGAAA